MSSGLLIAESGDAKLFGFTTDHWNAIRQYVSDREFYVFFRGGKSEAVPYIERGFPAKPSAIKAKVDAKLGLLVVSSPADAGDARGKGFYIVESAGPDGQYVASTGNGRRRSGKADRWPARANVVMAELAGNLLPITSDYDLAAVFDANAHTNDQYSQAAVLGGYRHVSEPADYWKEYGQQIKAPPGGESNLSKRVREELNCIFGAPDRIEHGPQAVYQAGQLASAAPGGDGDETSDRIIAFCPEMRVYWHKPSSALESQEILFEYMKQSRQRRR
jgi:hypothetical protein